MAFGGFLGAAGASKGIKQLKKALKFQKQVFNETKAQVKPFVEGGTEAFQTLADGDFRNREFYQFRQDELNRQIKRSSAQKGSLFSGAAIEAEARGNMILSGEQVDREQNLLFSLANMGLQGTQLQAQAGGQAGANVGNISANIAGMQQTRGQLLGGAIDETIGAAAGAALGFSSFGGVGATGAGASQYTTPAGPPSLRPSLGGF